MLKLFQQKIAQYTFLSILLLIAWNCSGRPVAPSYENRNEQKKEQLPAPTIKVYVENSGSMDGYVKGVTDFENAVYSYLSDLQHADLGQKDSASHKNRLELNYINSEVLTHKSDVEEFIRKLEPATFKMRGGNRNTSDMSDILDSILKRMESPNDVSIFISDCIFSPGKRYKPQDNAYLVAQQIGIRNHLTEYLMDNPDLGVVVMRLISQFDGNYYNKFDDPTYIKDKRPFYICLFGNKKQLKRIMNEINKDRIVGSGVQNVFMLSKANGELNYGLLFPQCVGEFIQDKANPKTTVTGAKPEKNGGISQFQLAVGVDYSHYLVGETYLMNANNYSISNKAYTLAISKNSTSNSTYTHVLKLNLNQPIISKGSIKITLLNRLPEWIAQYTDESGLDINAPGAMEKTYGFKYLMQGIYDAYSTGQEKYGSITINIK